MAAMDRIFINDLRVECIIGTLPHEREQAQSIWINVTLELDLKRAGGSDELEDTVDYKTLADAIATLAVDTKAFLLERLATAIAGLCLASPAIHTVIVRIDKPQALETARSAAVEIIRKRA